MTSAIRDDVGGRCRIVLQLNCEVIQTRFLIVKRATAADVKLSRRILTRRCWWHKSRRLSFLAAGGITGTIVYYESGGNALAGKTGRIDGYGWRSSTTQQASAFGADGP